jgi:hypothetical protein
VFTPTVFTILSFLLITLFLAAAVTNVRSHRRTPHTASLATAITAFVAAFFSAFNAINTKITILYPLAQISDWLSLGLMVTLIGLVASTLYYRMNRPRLCNPNPTKPSSLTAKPEGPVTEERSSNLAREPAIFICYRREDSADVTGRIFDRLVQFFGQDGVFRDVDSIPLGVDFRKHLDQMVAKCTFFIAVIGDCWLTSDRNGRPRLEDAADFVRIEIESALRRDIPVIPVVVRNASMPSHEQLPAALQALAHRNAIAIRSDPDFHKDMDRLIAGIKTYSSRSQRERPPGRQA